MFTMLIAAAALIAMPPAIEVRRLAAADANQGVVSDGRYLYALGDSAIAKLDPETGRQIARWDGDPAQFKHMNSCFAIGRRLVCTNSNYPSVPSASAIEWFDSATMRHVATRALGHRHGSLTWVNWHDNSWWACFAEYDGKGGDPGLDHRATTIVRYDKDFAERDAWLLPDDVLDRMAPKSSSGGVWGADGYLYITGHDRPELYVMKLPEGGPILIHVATIAIPTDGQAIAWDAREPRLLWSIERATHELVASRIPMVPR